MTIGILTVFVALLFIALCYLHYKHSRLSSKFLFVSTINAVNTIIINNLVTLLEDKKLIDDADKSKIFDLRETRTVITTTN